MADGMTAGHLAGKAVIKAHRADLPVGLSLAIVDDVVVGDDASVRDRKRAEVYERWLDFEWVFDFGHQLGLHEVDRETFVRTPRPSAGVYADLVKRFRA